MIKLLAKENRHVHNPLILFFFNSFSYSLSKFKLQMFDKVYHDFFPPSL